MGDAINSRGQAANYSSQAAQARTQGALQRRQAYANAYKLQNDSAQQGYIVGDQLMTMRQNAVAALSATRAENATSGFASSGSKLRTEQSTAEVLDAAIANLGKSYTIADQNARAQAAQYMREGDTALTLANIQAGYYDKLSSTYRKIAPWQLMGSALTIGSQIMGQFNFSGSPAAASPSTAPAAGAANPLYIDPYGFTGRQRT